MTQSPDHEAPISRLEVRIEDVAADAAAARHLAAANDRDFADLAGRVDANRRAINAFGEQTRERFDRLDGRFDRLEGRSDRLEGRFDALETKVDEGLAAMRHGFDQTAAGFARILELITAPGGDQ